MSIFLWLYTYKHNIKNIQYVLEKQNKKSDLLLSKLYQKAIIFLKGNSSKNRKF